MIDTYITYYLIGINILGLLLFLLNRWLYTHTEKGQIDIVLTITAIIGGSVGIVIAFLISGHEAKKENMMSVVFAFTVMVIEIIVFLFYKGYYNGNITFAFWDFFSEHKLIIVYLLAINIITLIAFGIDKIAAAERNVPGRIRIVTLLGLTFIGGSIGALIGMYAFRHKTRKNYFYVGVPMMLVMHIVVIFYFMNV